MVSSNLGRFAASASLTLLLLVWGVRLSMLVVDSPGPKGLWITCIFALVGGAICFAALRKNRSTEEPKLPKDVWIQTLIAPVLGSTLLLLAWIRAGHPIWAMNGDMVWNTRQSLFVHTDGGIGFGELSNPAPLTNVLFALSYGPGTNPSLGWILASHGWVLLLLAAIVSLVGGSYTAIRTRVLHPFVSVCLVFAVGWLPYSGVLLWQVTGLGHANVYASYLLLWFAVAIFAEESLSLKTRIGFLLIVTTVTATSWAPLVVIPATLTAVLAVWEFRRSGTVGTLRGWAWPLVASVQAGAYAIFITLPDFRMASSALGADGGALPLQFPAIASHYLLFAVALVLTGWLARRKLNPIVELNLVNTGLLAALLFSIVGFAYLVLQRVGLDTSLLGYYAVKYIGFVFTLIAGAIVGQIAALIPRRSGLVSQILYGALALPIFLAATVGSFNYELSQRSLVPGLTAVIQTISQEQSDGVTRMMEIFDEDPFGANIMLVDDLWTKIMVNGYLIQLSAASGDEPIRAFAYDFEQWSDDELCELVMVWDRDVTVHVDPDQITNTQARFGGCSAAARVSVVAWPEV